MSPGWKATEHVLVFSGGGPDWEVWELHAQGRESASGSVFT